LAKSSGISDPKEVEMDNFSFGLTMLIVGMGGTLVALSLLALLMGLLKKLFPIKEESQN
jgi:Na+-transporting methylmalonyl-CoA/oxaloacetate decarboxylase gamma subunit